MSVEIYNVEQESKYIRYYCKGSFDLDKIVEMFGEITADALQNNAISVLVDVMNISGSPSVMERYSLGEQVAQITKELPRRFAVIGKEPLVEEDDFAALVAINRGRYVKTFSDEHEAIAWLES